MKKMLTWLLILAMLLSLAPLSVFAAKTDDAKPFPFKDVAKTAWYYEPVNYAYQNGLMSGMSDTTFVPSGSLTRAMFVTILGRLDGMDPKAYVKSDFKDVPNDKWYTAYVTWAAKNDIVYGVGDGLFSPGSNVNREQIAAILARYVTFKGIELPAGEKTVERFADQKAVSSWATDGLELMRRTGIIQGDNQGNFNPKATASRAEAATMFMRLQQAIEAADKTKPAPPEQTDLPGEYYPVVYLLNDGSEGAYRVDRVHEGAKAARPEDPVKVDYAFTGWYTDPACLHSYAFDEPVNGEVILYGGWSAPDGKEGVHGIAGEAAGNETVYSITDLTCEGEIVSCTINTNSAADLKVEVLDENTREVISSVVVETPDYCELTPVQVPLDRLPPAHFILRAVLTDGSDELCAPFETRAYTSNYALFEGKTVRDFPNTVVLNYDENLSDNFGVLAPGVIRVNTGAGSNVLRAEYDETVEDGVVVETTRTGYRFRSPSEQVLNLKSGDVVLAKDADGYYQLFMVGEARKEADGSCFITENPDAQLTDFYQYLKVDTDTFQSEGDAEALQAAETDAEALGVEVIDVDGTFEASLGAKIDFSPKKWLQIHGSFTGSAEVEVKMVYDVVLFGKDYFEMKIEVTRSTDLEITVEATNDYEEKDGNDKNVLCEFKVPEQRFQTPIVGVEVKVNESVPITLTFSGKATFHRIERTISGFTYDTVNKKQDIDKKDSSITLSAEGEIEVKVGIKVEIAPCFMNKVVEVKLTVEAGLKTTASTELGKKWTDEEEIHGCTLCLSGKAQWYVEAEAKLEVHIVPDILEGTLVDAKLFSLEGPVRILDFGSEGEYYISIINSRDSMFGGKLHLGGGSCPNKQYRVRVTAVDDAGNPVDGVSLTLTNGSGKKLKTDTTTLMTHVFNGMYTVTANFGASTSSQLITVADGPVDVTIRKDSRDAEISGVVYDQETNKPLKNAEIVLMDQSVPVYTAFSDAKGAYQFKIPVGNFTLSVGMDGYVTEITHGTAYSGKTIQHTSYLRKGTGTDENNVSDNYYLYGAAQQEDNGIVRLTPLQTWTNGSAWKKHSVTTTGGFEITFSYMAGGGRGDSYNGADGLVCTFADRRGLGGQGEYLGFVTGNSVGVEFDSYPHNPGDPGGKHIAVIQSSVSNHLTSVLSDTVDDGIWHDVSIVYDGKKIVVSQDGSEVLSQEIALPDRVFLGLSAATGAGKNAHYVRDVEVKGLTA